MIAQRVHILSVNLEDYFQVGPLRHVIPPRHWPRFDLRVDKATQTTLDLLDRYGAKATFFTLGWLVERRPDLLQEIVRRGHEVASKGYLHARAEQMSLEQFSDDLRRSRDAIENVTGQSLLGYRIAEGSLPTDDLAHFKALADAGLKYDSSVRPFGLRFAGKPEWRHVRHLKGDGWTLAEVPLSSDTLFGIPVPVTGGNYLRQIPQSIFRSRLHSFHERSSDPLHFYFHTWELDPNQPRITAISSLERVRQYRNLEGMRERVESVLADHRFESIAGHLGLAAAPVARHEPAAKVAVAPRRVGAGLPVTVVVPCYNEEDTLSYLSGTLSSFAEQNPGLDLRYVFVDDGSKDQTWKVLHDLFGKRPDCTLIQHPLNRGIAAATMTGIRAANTEIVCGIDCDCSFDPHTLADMIPLLGDGVDMVQASPYHRLGGVVNVPGWRLALSRNLSRIYRRVLRHKFASYTACFRVYRRSSVVDLDLQDEGFLGIAELFIRLDQKGARIIEFPAVLESRLIGVSKMKTVRVIRAHLNMLLRLMRGQLDTPKRV